MQVEHENHGRYFHIFTIREKGKPMASLKVFTIGDTGPLIIGHIHDINTLSRTSTMSFYKQHGRSYAEELIIQATHALGLNTLDYRYLKPKGNRFLEKMKEKHDVQPRQWLGQHKIIVLPEEFKEKNKPVLERLEVTQTHP